MKTYAVTVTREDGVWVIDIDSLVSDLEHLDETLDTVEADRDRIRAQLIRAGLAARLSQAVVADVLGLSQQRVGQLSKAS